MLSDLKYVVCFECISKMKVPHPSHQIHTVPWFLYPHFVKPGMNGFVLEFKGFLLQLTCPSSHPHRPPPGGPPVPPTGFELRLRAAACSQGTDTGRTRGELGPAMPLSGLGTSSGEGRAGRGPVESSRLAVESSRRLGEDSGKVSGNPRSGADGARDG